MISNKAKSLQPIGGHSMLKRIYETVANITDETSFVVGYEKESITYSAPFKYSWIRTSTLVVPKIVSEDMIFSKATCASFKFLQKNTPSAPAESTGFKTILKVCCDESPELEQKFWMIGHLEERLCCRLFVQKFAQSAFHLRKGGKAIAKRFPTFFVLKIVSKVLFLVRVDRSIFSR